MHKFLFFIFWFFLGSGPSSAHRGLGQLPGRAKTNKRHAWSISTRTIYLRTVQCSSQNKAKKNERKKWPTWFAGDDEDDSDAPPEWLGDT